MFVLALSLAILGIVVGPVLGVVVDRAVERERIRPEHRCVNCRLGQGRRSLVPVLHWRLRCSGCSLGKGLRYVMIDVVTATVFAAFGLRFGVGWQLLPYLGLAAIVIVLATIDVETHLLPNVVMWPGIWTGLFAIFVLSGELDYPEGIGAALVGGAVFGGFIGLAHVVHEQGMGRGDVKLALLLGLFVGWLQPDLLVATRLVLYTIFLALLGGGLVGLVYNRVRSRGRSEIPFGPALALAALVIIVISPALTETL